MFKYLSDIVIAGTVAFNVAVYFVSHVSTPYIDADLLIKY